MTLNFIIFFWLFIEIWRISFGYKANIKESFPNLLVFVLVTFIFSVPCQVLTIVTPYVFPIDLACFYINIVFVFLEILFAIIAMIRMVKKHSAIFYLRNVTAKVNLEIEEVKTSNEIEEELFYHFPILKAEMEKMEKISEEDGKNFKKTN